METPPNSQPSTSDLPDPLSASSDLPDPPSASSDLPQHPLISTILSQHPHLIFDSVSTPVNVISNDEQSTPSHIVEVPFSDNEQPLLKSKPSCSHVHT